MSVQASSVDLVVNRTTISGVMGLAKSLTPQRRLVIPCGVCVHVDSSLVLIHVYAALSQTLPLWECILFDSCDSLTPICTHITSVILTKQYFLVKTCKILEI